MDQWILGHNLEHRALVAVKNPAEAQLRHARCSFSSSQVLRQNLPTKSRSKAWVANHKRVAELALAAERLLQARLAPECERGTRTAGLRLRHRKMRPLRKNN